MPFVELPPWYGFGGTLILRGPVFKAYVDSPTLEIQVEPTLPGAWQVLAGGLTEKAAGEITIRLGQVHPVEQVEHIRSKLQRKALPFHNLGEFRVDVG